MYCKDTPSEECAREIDRSRQYNSSAVNRKLKNPPPLFRAGPGVLWVYRLAPSMREGKLPLPVTSQMLP